MPTRLVITSVKSPLILATVYSPASTSAATRDLEGDSGEIDGKKQVPGAPVTTGEWTPAGVPQGSATRPRPWRFCGKPREPIGVGGARLLTRSRLGFTFVYCFRWAVVSFYDGILVIFGRDGR